MINLDKLNLSILTTRTIETLKKQPEIKSIKLFGETQFLYGYRVRTFDDRVYTIYSRDKVEDFENGKNQD